MRVPRLLHAIVPLAGVATIAAAQPCAKKPVGATANFYVEPGTMKSADTVVVGHLCLFPGTKGIGSYTASLTYDSTKMRIVRADAYGGMQVSNTKTAGLVRIAGAAPGGFPTGRLASITFRPIGFKALGSVRLAVSEANTTSGVSLVKEIRTTGWMTNSATGGVKAVLSHPVIDSIRPRSAEVSEERVTDLVLYGRGFAPGNNVVLFGGAEVHGLLSEAGGTIVRFAAPTQVPAGNTSRRITAGRVQVRVRHGGGTSNAVSFTVKVDE